MPHKKGITWALLLLAVWLPFGATLSQERIGDDFILIESRLGPEHVHSPLQLWTENYWGAYDNCGLSRPLSLSLLYAQRQLFGLQTVPYRVISLLLYSACGLLCFLFLLAGFAQAGDIGNAHHIGIALKAIT